MTHCEGASPYPDVMSDLLRAGSGAVAFHFNFELVGTGWAAATISDGAATSTITASYLGDAHGDLLLAIWVLLEGDPASRCSWWEEPGEYRWLFARDVDQVTLTVLAFDELWGHEPDIAGRSVFTTTRPLRGVAMAVAGAAEAVLSLYGTDGYRRKWVDKDFPSDTLAAILAALDDGAAKLDG
jgi:hypothetical protein